MLSNGVQIDALSQNNQTTNSGFMKKGQKKPYYGKRTKTQIIEMYFESSASRVKSNKSQKCFIGYFSSAVSIAFRLIFIASIRSKESCTWSSAKS